MMPRLATTICITALAIVLATAASARAAPRIQFELATEDGFPLTGAQRWVELLRDLEQTNIRIRSARAGDQQSVENLGTEQSPSYLVLGILTSRNRLLLVGGKSFSLNDRAGIAKWIETLEQDGIEGLTAERVAFGLTSDELVAFHERLARPVASSTKEARAIDVARQIVRGLAIETEVTSAARQAFARNESVLDELQGLSSGTALAALLRPLGLVAAPQKQAGQVRLSIGETSEITESWPVGWPPQEAPYKTAPLLFEYLNVEIVERPLSEALTAIQARVQLPFLYDHNGMARHRIDPAEATVSFPRKRTFYKKALETVLFQAHLRSELRVDEAGTPFLWISSVKR